jgi:hypothetical protein
MQFTSNTTSSAGMIPIVGNSRTEQMHNFRQASFSHSKQLYHESVGAASTDHGFGGAGTSDEFMQNENYEVDQNFN